MKTVADYQSELHEIQDQLVAFVDLADSEKRDLTDEEQAEVDALEAQIEPLQAKLEKRQKLENHVKQIAAARSAPIIEQQQQIAVDEGFEVGDLEARFDRVYDTIRVPAKARRHGRLTAFAGAENPERDAYVTGQFFLATIFENESAHTWCQEHGLIRNDLSVGTPAKGGYTVPTPLEATLLRLREARSVITTYGRNWPMGAMTLDVPRLPDDVTATWTAEAAEITATDPTFAQARITAEKLACLTKVSTELDEDSVLDIGNIVAQSMAWASADKIDQAGFNGDGSPSFGNITGLASALHANAIVTGSNIDPKSLTFADYEAVMAKLPIYPGATPRWYVNSEVYYTSMAKLLNAAGGNTIQSLEAGPGGMMFLGYPVVMTQVLPTSGASAKIVYFGDLSQGVQVGNRRAFNTQFSLERYFEFDQIGIRSTQRIGITVSENGQTDKTRPIVGLALAAT